MKHLSKSQEYLFYLIIIALPFGARHVFNFAQVQNIEGFRENISWSVYGFDILIILLLLTFLLRCAITKKILIKISILIYIFCGWILLSTFFSQNQAVAFYNSTRIIEAILLFLIAKKILTNREVLQKSALIIFLGGIFQSILAIFQFVFQKSIGFKLLGESLVSPDILGVAKVEIGGTIWQNVFHTEKIIRAYGTLPHPNLLGAFLLFSLACGIYLHKLKSQKSQPEADPPATPRLLRDKPLKEKLLFFGSFLILIGILLTFSRSIWLATFILLFLIYFQCYKNKSILNSRSKFEIQNSKFFLLIATIIILIATLIISPRLCLKNCPNDQSFSLRQKYNKISFQIIKDNPLLGVGPGNFTHRALKLSFGNSRSLASDLKPWQIQPVHNIYLLIASEIGIVGLIIFIVLIFENLKFNHWKLFRNCLPSEASVQVGKLNIGNSKDKTGNIHYLQIIFLILFILFLILGLFDHYFWTLAQGQLLFWLSLAFLAASGTIKDEFKQKKYETTSKDLRTEKI